MFTVVQIIDRNQPVGQNPFHLNAVPTKQRLTSINQHPIFQIWLLIHKVAGLFLYLLLVKFGSVDVSFLDVHYRARISALVVVKDHFSPQHLKFMEVLPRLYHKVTRVASHRHKDIHVLTRLKRKKGDNKTWIWKKTM